MTSATVKIRFTSKLHFGSQILAILAQSERFNHCMMFDEGRVWEAVCWHGVRNVEQEVSMHGVKIYQDMELVVPNIEAMREFLRSVEGDGYDWAGAIGIPFLRSDNWQDPGRWWCSELLIAALHAGGLDIIAFSELERGTPNDLFQYPAPKSEIIRVT